MLYQSKTLIFNQKLKKMHDQIGQSFDLKKTAAASFYVCASIDVIVLHTNEDG